jgi:cytochrome c oxidase cbb3-type subunit 3
MSLRFPELLALAAALATASACERETRHFRDEPAAAAPAAGVRVSTLEPGPATSDRAVGNPYEDNAWAVAEGKRLYSQFNCVGCHAHGGGGMGPPLMDAAWRYGAAPANVIASIAEGRPNGMPAFGPKVGTQQIWQLAAYVRSMSGLVAKDVAPSRSDEMQVKAPEMAAPKAVTPRNATAEPPLP